MASPEHTNVVQLLRAFGVAEKVGTPIEEQRLAYEAAGAAYPLAEGVTVTPVSIPGSAGPIPAEWVEAAGVGGSGHSAAVGSAGSRSARTLLYLHGGGYVLGSCSTHRELASRLSAACAARVLVIAYRLGPEHPFPAALDDAAAAYSWLLGGSADGSGSAADGSSPGGVDPGRLVVAGDSAGGGLTLALLLRLSGEGRPLPSSAVCLSPWVDLALTGESLHSRADDDPIVSRGSLQEMAGFYLAGHDPRDPLASPLYADLTGLPPLLVQVGTAEVLLDDARRITAAAQRDKVDVTLQEFPDLIHVFQAFAATAPEAAGSLAKIGEFIAAHCA